MINLNAEVEIFAVEMINLNVEIAISAIKLMASLIFEINCNGRYTKIFLIKQNITVFFQIIMVKSKIWYLVFCFVIIIFEDKYPVIVYCRFF